MYQRREISILKLRFEEYSKFNETIKENSAICFFLTIKLCTQFLKEYAISYSPWR